MTAILTTCGISTMSQNSSRKSMRLAEWLGNKLISFQKP